MQWTGEFDQYSFRCSKRGARLTLRRACLVALAFVFGKLNPETLLCVRNPVHGGRRNLELAIAEGADANGGNLTQPLQHSKIAFRHAQPLTALLTALTVLREAPFLAARLVARLEARNFETAAFARAIVVFL
jgi:hypothetical protein